MANHINGKEISAPIWGEDGPALLTTWSEIKKLGFKKRDRFLGQIANEDGTSTPALYFFTAKYCSSLTDEQRAQCRYRRYVTTETLDEITD